jgi:hypothetical protein
VELGSLTQSALAELQTEKQLMKQLVKATEEPTLQAGSATAQLALITQIGQLQEQLTQLTQVTQGTELQLSLGLVAQLITLLGTAI